jgi:hypothetical protein
VAHLTGVDTDIARHHPSRGAYSHTATIVALDKPLAYALDGLSTSSTVDGLILGARGLALAWLSHLLNASAFDDRYVGVVVGEIWW